MKKLKNLFTQDLGNRNKTAESGSREDALQLATAVLLVEMSRADYVMDKAQQQSIIELLSQCFELTENEANLLLEVAHEEADAAVSLHEFTRLLNERLSYEDRIHVVEMLWRVAAADDELHKYEDALVRKVADLLYVRHSDLVRSRHRVLGE
ncbi:MAG: TerB family tellurite resistance protein [Gammaproteobacteria bacterium]